MIETSHQLRNEQAEAFAAHVAARPELIRPPEEADSARLNALLQARAARHTASLLRHGSDPAYMEWLGNDPIGKATEAKLQDEPLEPVSTPLPDTILGVEKDIDHCRNERLGLLWLSGQQDGLGQAGSALLDAWDYRSDQLASQRTDLFNRLRIDFNHLSPDEAANATRIKANQKSRLIMLEAHKTMERDGIAHLPSTDALAEKLMPLVGAGKHILLMGPRGTAKSRFADYIAQKSMEFAGTWGTPNEITLTENTPESEVVGRWLLVQGQTQFEPGPLLKALIEDKPIIIDEFNNAGHELTSMLQRIMLLKPGKSLILQQGNSTVSYERGKNFCIIATANPNGKTYARNEIDPAMRERFTGAVHEISYPDVDVELGEEPVETLQLLETFLTDKSGLVSEPNDTWTAEDTEMLAKIAHWTQYLASHPASSIQTQEFQELFDQTNYGTLQPVLTDVVLGPRAMLELVSQAQADPNLRLSDALVRFADAPDLRTHATDRKIFADLLHELNLMEAEDIEQRLHLPGFQARPRTVGGGIDG